MKAIVVSEFGNEDVLRHRDADLPEPAAGEVRVRMRAVGINPVETYIRTGKHFPTPQLPYIPGRDGAGVVDALGPGVSGLKKGDRVYVAALMARRATGTYAEYTVCDADTVHPLPDAYTFSEGAGLGTPGLTAAYALFGRARLRPGESVLIHGAASGVGTLAAQLARKAGAIVLGTAGDKAGMELAADLGCRHVFNHNEEGYAEKIVAATSGKGVDAVVEMLANVNLMKDLFMLARYGRIVVVGSRGPIEFLPRDAMVKEADILGLMAANMRPNENVAAVSTLNAALENGLRVPIDHELPLAEAAKAHRDVMARGKKGKIILTIA